MCTILVIILLLHVLIHWVFFFPSFSDLFPERNTTFIFTVYYVLQQPYEVKKRNLVIRIVSRHPCYLRAFYDGIQVRSIGLPSRFLAFVVEFKKRNPSTPLVFRHPSYLCAYYDGTQTASSELPSRSILARRETSWSELFPATVVICVLCTTAYKSDRLVYSLDRYYKKVRNKYKTAISIQIKIRAQGPTPSYGTESTAGPFPSFRL